MATFPEVDPADLTQSIKTYTSSRQDINCLANGATANSINLFRGVSDAITTTQNTSNSYFESSLQSEVSTNSILFFTSTTLLVGQWVYQVSPDIVALASSASSATGPAIGVVMSLPTPSTVLVQIYGSFQYTPAQYQYIPMTADVSYYLGQNGMITSAPNPGAGGFIQKVGYSKNTEQFIVDIGDVTLV
jgi:hypothetical protein